jgi:hypothetical protein
MIRAASITAIYLFDIAESVDLAALPALLGGKGEPAQLPPRPGTPSYVRYQTPPLQFDASPAELPVPPGFQLRVKVFDYGVVSLALSRPFSGSWTELIALAHQAERNPELEARAEQCARTLAGQLAPALREPRGSFLSEDYVVFAVTAFEPPVSADALIEQHGDEIALLLRGEREALSQQEREELFRHRLSYFATDLVVPTWNTALVCDTEAGVQAALELIEYANSQLLQFRYYDEKLDDELAAIYRELQLPARWYESWFGRRFARAAKHVHALVIDVTELTERTENALKLVGDVYAARLLFRVSSRLGLPEWQASVKDKLKTLDDIYHFAVDQTSMDRGENLELAIVLILIFELILFFMGIMN